MVAYILGTQGDPQSLSSSSLHLGCVFETQSWSAGLSSESQAFQDLSKNQTRSKVSM